jgi:ABC-2 type transport system permease protein
MLRAEFKLEYNDVFRRKSVFISMLLYPYIFTAFTLLLAYAGGSPRIFEERFGVSPVIYLMTASYTLMSMLVSVDVLLWRPLFDEENGTLIYIIASPVNRLKYYLALPFPRYVEVLILGATSALPVYTYFYRLEGLVLGLLIISLIALGSILMIPFAIFIAGLVHRVGESWRVLNIVRPVLMILIGVYYPRFYMPLVGRVVSGVIPSAHIVEVIQAIVLNVNTDFYRLFAIAIALFILYAPIGRWSITSWEWKKVREGVKVT